jgi:hypothetical protein
MKIPAPTPGGRRGHRTAAVEAPEPVHSHPVSPKGCTEHVAAPRFLFRATTLHEHEATKPNSPNRNPRARPCPGARGHGDGLAGCTYTTPP